jgi:diguanylate cyclase (GGDEF)-like protein/PAS domain S-box-containing protein
LFQSHQNLEKTVEQRTEELSSARDELQGQIDLVDRYVITSKSDEHGIITYASDAFCQISQYDESELIGQPHSIVRHPDMPASLYEEMWKALKAGRTWQGEIKNRAKDGSAYWVDVNIEPQFNGDGSIMGYAAVRQDITDKKRIEELSVTDTLTQLFNRLKLDETLAREVDRATRYQHPLSVVIFDIDYFKKVNDTYGHQAGDSVLIQMADIIRNTVRTTDVAGRWGGEEFLVICSDTALFGAVELSDRLCTAVASHDFGEVGRITSSFGVATLENGGTETSILAEADAALYRAKEEGRNRVVVA